MEVELFLWSLVSDSHLIGAVSPEKYRNNLNTPGDDFRSCFRILGSTADTRAPPSVYGFWGQLHVFSHVKVDLESRGRCRVLFTPENLDILSTGRVSGIHASDGGGSWKNSLIFYVKVDSEWKGTSRICFRFQRSKFSGGAVHHTLEPEAPLAPLTESFTAEVLARHRSSSLSHPVA